MTGRRAPGHDARRSDDGRGRRLPWLVGQALVIMLISTVALVVAGPVPPASADGLAVASATSYVVDPDQSVVHVTSDVTVTNTVPDRRDGSVVRQTYYSGFSLPAPVGAVDVSAVQGATPLATTVTEDPSGDFSVIEIDLARDLFFGQRATVTVTYDIVGAPPRSADPTRVNPAYASFFAWGVGDPGQVSVSVIVPERFDVDVLGAEVQRTDGFGSQVYTATDIAEPDQFVLFVSARDDAALSRRPVELDDASFQLQSWPGDDEWSRYVESQLTAGVPALAARIGQPWPIRQRVDVREAFTPYLYGYAGWFDATNNELEIGEDLDADVVLHELSHAWFNQQLFPDRWLNEGLAEAYAAAALTDLGGTPGSPEPVLPTDAGAVRLVDWQSPVFDTQSAEVEAEEAYGYRASWYVVDQILDDVGFEAMASALDAASDRTIAYLGDGDPEVVEQDNDWRRVLDLFEHVAGSDQVETLLRELVLTDEQIGELADRRSAIDEYDDLVRAGGSWAAPIGVRRSMSAWAFPEALDRMATARAALDRRDQLDELVTPLALEPSAELERSYESAEDLDDITATLDAHLRAADVLTTATAAVEADRGLLDRIGLWGEDPDADLAAARTAFEAGRADDAATLATAALETMDQAGSVGTRRAAIAGGAALGLVALAGLAVVLGRRRRRRRLDPVSPVPPPPT